MSRLLLIAAVLMVGCNSEESKRIAKPLGFAEQYAKYQDYIKKNVHPLLEDMDAQMQRNATAAANGLKQSDGHKPLEVERFVGEFDKSINMRHYEIQLEPHIKKLDEMYIEMLMAAEREKRSEDMPQTPGSIIPNVRDAQKATVNEVREMLKNIASRPR